MSKQIKNIILDFDYTLFNAASFKREMMAELGKLGVSQKVFKRTYRQAIVTTKNSYDYSVSEHLTLIVKQQVNLNYKQAEESIDKVITESAKHLYAQAHIFLKILNLKGYKLVLITRGNKTWQALKIKNTKVNNYFDKIIISPKWKTDSLQKMTKIVKYAYFVSDHIDEVVDIKKFVSTYQPILKLRYRRDLRVAKNFDIPAFRTLREIKSYILKNS